LYALPRMESSERCSFHCELLRNGVTQDFLVGVKQVAELADGEGQSQGYREDIVPVFIVRGPPPYAFGFGWQATRSGRRRVPPEALAKGGEG
jgi:hypothetical protein